MAGTASTVRAFLLLENAGPWGENALRDARLPDGLGDELTARAAAAGVRVLLIRRPGRRPPATGSGLRGVRPPRGALAGDDRARRHPRGARPRRRGAGRRTVAGLTPHPDPVFAVCTHGRHDTCCAERGRPVAAALAAAHPELTWEVSHIGGDRFAANALVLPHGLYYGRLDADSVGRGGAPPTWTGGWRWSTCAAGPASPRRCSTRRSRCAGTSARRGSTRSASCPQPARTVG